jgi:iron complex transport system substrate-binding protein
MPTARVDFRMPVERKIALRRGGGEVKASATKNFVRRLAAVALCACLSTAANSQQTLIDDRGVAVSLPAAPHRIVSLLPSLTECVCALGACALLVGTDRFSNWPQSVVALPKVGGLDDAQIESIVGLKPDVVLVSSSARVTDRLESIGLKVVVLESRNRTDLHRTLGLLASMIGAQAAGERVWNDVETQTRQAAARVPPTLRGKRVYFEIDSTPYAAGTGSFVGETLMRLGLPNAIPAELGSFPKLNPEFVVRIQPDIVMASQRDLESMTNRPGWSSLKALQRGQTCGFAGPRYDLLIRPGPRMGEAAGILADCLVEIANGRR